MQTALSRPRVFCVVLGVTNKPDSDTCAPVTAFFGTPPLERLIDATFPVWALI